MLSPRRRVNFALLRHCRMLLALMSTVPQSCADRWARLVSQASVRGGRLGLACVASRAARLDVNPTLGSSGRAPCSDGSRPRRGCGSFVCFLNCRPAARACGFGGGAGEALIHCLGAQNGARVACFHKQRGPSPCSFRQFNLAHPWSGRRGLAQVARRRGWRAHRDPHVGRLPPQARVTTPSCKQVPRAPCWTPFLTTIREHDSPASSCRPGQDAVELPFTRKRACRPESPEFVRDKTRDKARSLSPEFVVRRRCACNHSERHSDEWSHQQGVHHEEGRSIGRGGREL